MEGKADGKVGLTDVKPEIKNDSDTKDGDKDEVCVFIIDNFFNLE